jgi:membrane protein YdbS with pleckstrin-like domain
MGSSSLKEAIVMTTIQDKVTTFWRDAINLVLGIWLIVSPLALGYTAQTTPAWNAYAIGIVVAVLSAAALWQFQKWEEWLSALLGAWLIVSPWILG